MFDSVVTVRVCNALKLVRESNDENGQTVSVLCSLRSCRSYLTLKLSESVILTDCKYHNLNLSCAAMVQKAWDDYIVLRISVGKKHQL